MKTRQRSRQTIPDNPPGLNHGTVRVQVQLTKDEILKNLSTIGVIVNHEDGGNNQPSV